MKIKHALALIVLGFIALISLGAVWGSFYTLKDTEKALVMTFGKVTDVTSSGLNFKIPFTQSIQVVDITQKTDKAENLSAVSADQQKVTTTIAVNYRWDEHKLPEIYQEIKLDIDRVLGQRVSEAVKSTTAKYTAYDLISKREVVREEIENKLRTELKRYNIILDAMQIVDFRFSKEYEDAIEAKMTADQVAKKAEMDLKRIEVEAKQRITTAQAEAEAIRIQAEAVKSQGGAEYVRLKEIEKWNGSIPLGVKQLYVPAQQMNQNQ